MTKILFICHGNICRSTAAEFIMKQLVREAGLAGEFEIASAATSRDEIGNTVYPETQRTLDGHGVAWKHRAARQMTKADYAYYDLLIGMDTANLRDMKRICGGDPDGKLHKMLEFCAEDGDGEPRAERTSKDGEHEAGQAGKDSSNNAHTARVSQPAQAAVPDVADPWYTRDFETAYREIDAGCRALLRKYQKGEQL